MSHQLKIALQTQIGSFYWQAGGPKDCIHATYVAFADESKLFRESRGKQHAGADRLAVQPGAVAGSGLDSVAKCVTEIQQCPHTIFSLVEADDLGLDGAGALDRVGERLGLAL